MLMAIEVELGLLVAKQSRKGFFPLFLLLTFFVLQARLQRSQSVFFDLYTSKDFLYRQIPDEVKV